VRQRRNARASRSASGIPGVAYPGGAEIRYKQQFDPPLLSAVRVVIKSVEAARGTGTGTPS